MQRGPRPAGGGPRHRAELYQRTRRDAAVSDDTKRGLARAPSASPAASAAIEVALRLAGAARLALRRPAEPDDARCFMPRWLASGACWGVTCQLYGLRSARNLGIGDFEDLARLAEIAARPRRRLYRRQSAACAVLRRCRPLQPLFAVQPPLSQPALHRRRQLEGVAPGELSRHRGRARRRAGRLSRRWRRSSAPHSRPRSRISAHRTSAPARRRRGIPDVPAAAGSGLIGFALFEALSEHFVAAGPVHAAGTTGRRPTGQLERQRCGASERENADRIAFHEWLQWVAESQLAAAQRRAIAAGMRIGLYLDLAVGVAPDGADTWSRPSTVIDGARIGARPTCSTTTGRTGAWRRCRRSRCARRRRTPARRPRCRHAPRRRRAHRPCHGLDGAFI